MCTNSSISERNELNIHYALKLGPNWEELILHEIFATTTKTFIVQSQVDWSSCWWTFPCRKTTLVFNLKQMFYQPKIWKLSTLVHVTSATKIEYVISCSWTTLLHENKVSSTWHFAAISFELHHKLGGKLHS